MEKVDITIIGAGVVGLAVAEKLSQSGKTIVILEKHERYGVETSSRNSEVIHSGIYYPSGTLKAQLCVEGNRMLYALSEEKHIPYANCGKLLIACDAKEEERLQHFYERGKANGVPGLTMISKREVKSLEPLAEVYSAMLVPSTGIIDTEALMHYYHHTAEEQGAMFLFKSEVIGITYEGNHYYKISYTGQDEPFETAWIINCAGLYADRVAALAGIDIDKAVYRLRYYKGEYYALKNSGKYTFNRLIYPLPEGEGTALGIHLGLNLKNQVRFGPDRYEVKELDYTMNEEHKQEFVTAIQRYLPFVTKDDLIPDTCGIRAHRAVAEGVFHDFVIQEESDKGLPGMVNLVGIESPGLTAAPAIAEYVAKMIT